MGSLSDSNEANQPQLRLTTLCFCYTRLTKPEPPSLGGAGGGVVGGVIILSWGLSSVCNIRSVAHSSLKTKNQPTNKKIC